MGQASGELVEIYLENGLTGGRLLCPPKLIPAPGQYLLAHNPTSDAPLPAPVFSAGSVPGGFMTAPPIPGRWQPGISLTLRGPLGRGFALPPSARCVALAALGETPARLRPMLVDALRQNASVVLVSDLELPDLPPEVEIQSVAGLVEVMKWADYIALDLLRASLPGLREKLGLTVQARFKLDAQALVLTPMPCGGIAECGVCAVAARRGWKMACKDGPVFDLKELT
jgi:NAD(P)H-flavin reductase